jgi:pimeloyl-ACP methyl ester carboxylesterase
VRSDAQIVCLHGLGRTPADWDGVRGRLGSFGDVIAPQLPMAATAGLELLDRLLVPGSIVVAHSMGAVLAMRLAATRPRPLRAAVLTGCFFAPARNGRTTAATIRDYGSHRIAFLADTRRRRIQRAARGSLTPLALLVRQAVRARSFEVAFENTTGSVLVVHARDDHYVPVDFAMAAAQRHPTWDLRVLAEGGHHAHVSRPDSWSDVIDAWLAGHP